MKKHCVLVLVSILAFLSICMQAAEPGAIPVARNVDIVVAGGGCGAVALAESAARSGTKVLVITSRNYLGEDIAGTMQLWLEPQETPVEKLARDLFTDPFANEKPGLNYTYTADQPSQKRHPDTNPPSRLQRRRPATDPQHESVQYENDVTITADLGKVIAVRDAAANAFRRAADFGVRNLSIQVSTDGETYEVLGDFKPMLVGDRQEFTAPIRRPVRFVRLRFQRDEKAGRILLGSIKFSGETGDEAPDDTAAIRPLHAKKTLEKALSEAGVEFLFGCYPTGLLRDASGGISGLVLSDRMGRQAIQAKVIVDCTEHAVLAHIAGAGFRPATASESTVRWVAISEKPTERDGLAVRKLPIPVTVYDIKGQRDTGKKAAWYEYTLKTNPADDLLSRMALETRVRELCYNPTQHYSADIPRVTPATSIVSSKGSVGTCQDTGSIPASVCTPRGIERLWVLSGCSDVSRDTVDRFLRPVNLMSFGARLGKTLATVAADLPEPQAVTVSMAATSTETVPGHVREALSGLRPVENRESIPMGSAALPVLGRYEVVVVGGGTSGAPAGIAAARNGAKTLVLEYLHGLGGVGTLGMIGKYWYGNRVGFAKESPENPIEARMQFYLSELRKAGGEVWFGALGCGAVTDGDRVTGVVVATPFGCGIVKADVVIDGTGNADIAAVAGAETQFVEPFFALQQSHIPPREVGASYINGNRPPIDAADPIDVTAAMLKFPDRPFDRGQIVASRERRRIMGEYQLDWLDQLNGRTFPDTITYSKSDYDSHGYQVHPYFMLRPPREPGNHRKQFYSYVPYRCLIPKGLKGILVIGLGLSVHRDAMPIVRMQPDLQNIGYAAGVAASISVESGAPLRDIDIRKLQSRLITEGILGKEVLSHTDSYPVKETVLAEAIKTLPESYRGLGIVLAAPERALPMLRKTYNTAEGESRLAYAHVLGILGGSTGVPALVGNVDDLLKKADLAYRKEEDGMDRINQLMWALGKAESPEAVRALVRLVDAGAVNTSGRFRAVVVSLGAAKSKAGIPALTKLLESQKSNSSANELMAACALWECGDRSEAARSVLQKAATGTNGPFARLAQSMLLK